jgi:hypothetical protein
MSIAAITAIAHHRPLLPSPIRIAGRPFAIAAMSQERYRLLQRRPHSVGFATPSDHQLKKKKRSLV